MHYIKVPSGAIKCPITHPFAIKKPESPVDGIVGACCRCEDKSKCMLMDKNQWVKYYNPDGVNAMRLDDGTVDECKSNNEKDLNSHDSNCLYTV